MPSKELIEKVARAMAEADPQQCGNVNESEMGDYFWEQWREHYIPQAQAAISTILAALLEPTEGMLDACGENWYYGGVLWKPMLAASALGEQSDRAEIISADGAIWDETAPGSRNFKRREQSE